MPIRPLAIAALALGTGAALLGAQATTQLPDGPGKEQMVAVCGRCHEAQRSASLRLSREGWEKVIGDMVQRGAVISPSEQTVVLDYLATELLGEADQPLNINTATNIDLETVAGLTRKESAGLREWLKTNGNCKSLEDLKKAPLDYKKIEERKEYLLCATPLSGK